MRARFHDEVAAEVHEAILYYESRSAVAAAEFEAEFRRIIQEIKQWPEFGSPVRGQARRRLFQGFPYSVLYMVNPDHVYILAVAHSRQRWGYWLKRLE